MGHTVIRVDGEERALDIRAFNKLFPKDFLPLNDHHLSRGDWWLVYPDDSNLIVGFAGMVPFEPFPGVAYIKRTAVLKEHRGHRIQKKMIEACLEQAGVGCYKIVVSSTHISNHASSNSFIGTGFKLFEPERPWEKDSLFWIKTL
jgi:GNAT superfamily N-acetyltransferase